MAPKLVVNNEPMDARERLAKLAQSIVMRRWEEGSLKIFRKLSEDGVGWSEWEEVHPDETFGMAPGGHVNFKIVYREAEFELGAAPFADIIGEQLPLDRPRR